MLTLTQSHSSDCGLSLKLNGLHCITASKDFILHCTNIQDFTDYEEHIALFYSPLLSCKLQRFLAVSFLC